MTRFFVLLAASLTASMVVGLGAANAATAIDCTTNHFALPSTIPSGSYTIKGVCYGPFFTNPGDNTTLTGVAAGAGLDGQAVETTIGIDGSTVSIQSLAITGGSTAGNGGGVSAYDGASVTLQNSTVSGNTAHFYGGGIALDDATLHLNSSTVSGNASTTGGGGGVEVTNSADFYSSGSAISGNTAGGGPGGGVSVDLANTAGSAYITGTTISGNTAVDSGGGSYGGGLYLDGGAYVEVTSSAISHNTANGLSWGGGISVNRSDLYLTNTTVSGNAATQGGGIMYWGGSGPAVLGVSLETSSVDHNSSTSDGGGILSSAQYGNADLWIDGTTISSNSTRNGDGGGIANYGANGNTASVHVTNSSFGGNLARKGDGGAIYQSNGFAGNDTALVTLSNSYVGQVGHTLNPNVALHGGGIFNEPGDGSSNVTLQAHTNVVHNQATVNGGGLFNCSTATYTISASNVWLNSPNNVVNTPVCP